MERVFRSAQCRSSSTRRHPLAPARIRNRRRNPSATTTCETSPAAVSLVAYSGTILPRAVRKGESSGPSGSCLPRMAPKIASAGARKGVAATCSTARPARMRSPRCPAISAASRVSLDFPTPASPETMTMPPRPAAALSMAPRSASSSSSRPTSTGHTLLRGVTVSSYPLAAAFPAAFVRVRAQ